MRRLSVVCGAALVAAACGARSPLFLAGAAGGAPATGNVATGVDAAAASASSARTVSAAWSHTCAITGSGKVACWGESIADGKDAFGDAPVVVPGLDGVVEIAAGQLLDCARRSDGTVQCWGRATKGAVLPVRGARFDAIVAGAGTACGVADGGVACVGAPFLEGGACGSTIAPWDGTARTVPTLSGMAGVALGSFHACAFDRAGATWCWGCSGGDEPRLVYSLGSSAPSTDTPVAVSAAPSTTRILAATASTCAVQADGATLCWGDRSQFGTGITIQPTPPAAADFPRHPLDVGVGATFACAAYTDEVKCFGGQPTFADGCHDRLDAPQSFSLPGVREVSVGYQHVCARDDHGAVWCWGCNAQGEVGDGTRAPRGTPVHVLD